MTDLEKQLAALTCLWCKRGVPLLANGRHEMANGMEADCESKHVEILKIIEGEVADNLKHLNKLLDEIEYKTKEYFARPEVTASFKDWWKRSVQ